MCSTHWFKVPPAPMRDRVWLTYRRRSGGAGRYRLKYDEWAAAADEAIAAVS